MLIEFSTEATTAFTSPQWGEVERSEGEGDRFIRRGRNPSPAALTRVDLSLEER
jgi:hypothetical protein